MKALIISNGCITDYDFYRGITKDIDLVVCADGGARHARKLQIVPDILLGDMDSISEEDRKYYKEKGTSLLKLPVEKDATDTELAAEYAAERGANQIVFIGCTGSRLDHTLGNIALLSQLMKKGVQGCILNENNRIYITDSKIALPRKDNTRVSLLPVTQNVEGVNTRGLYYELKDADLHYDSSRGISNEFTADEAVIEIRNGELLVILSND